MFVPTKWEWKIKTSGTSQGELRLWAEKLKDSRFPGTLQSLCRAWEGEYLGWVKFLAVVWMISMCR
jgi:hypothetical protein